jgi:Tfp pilus assembly protein PilO
MSKARIWTIGTVALVLVLLIAGWELGISPMLTSVSAAQAQAATIQQSNAAGQAQLASLEVQYKGISKLKKALNKLRLSIPEDESASVFLNELATLCSENGVTLSSITLANATLYTAPAAAATTTPATDASSSDTPAPTTSAATTSPTTTTTGANGLVLIPVVIVVKGGFDAARDFADAAQQGSRLLYASQIEYSTNTDGTTVTITGNIFAMQGTSDSIPVKVKTLPNSTATPTPTLTPTPTPTSSATTSSSKSGSNTSPSTAPTTAPAATPDPTDTPTS